VGNIHGHFVAWLLIGNWRKFKKDLFMIYDNAFVIKFFFGEIIKLKKSAILNTLRKFE